MFLFISLNRLPILRSFEISLLATRAVWDTRGFTTLGVLRRSGFAQPFHRSGGRGEVVQDPLHALIWAIAHISKNKCAIVHEQNMAANNSSI